MTLIKSISGIRGTIGGYAEDGLSPLAVVKFTAAYAAFLKQNKTDKRLKVVVGRDARISGPMVNHLVVGTLMGCGVDVVQVGLCTTPGVELAVTEEKADGGIILTASHNPKQWNALKLLNHKGEFLNAADGAALLAIAEKGIFDFSQVLDLGRVVKEYDFTQRHIEMVLALPWVNKEAIQKANFSVVVDAVNSVGGTAIPALLEALGVKQVYKLYCEPTGHFPHNPEPLPEHLTEISAMVVDKKADLGIVVDPDVDRLALVCEDGKMFGEEYTLVAAADYVLSKKKGNTSSNLSSSRALRDVTESYGGHYEAAAVGEVNVVTKMREIDAIIGGEGNGGVIFPELHAGRDALVGVALFLSLLAERKMKVSDLRKTYPSYFISKNKVELTPSIDVDSILEKMKKQFAQERVTDIDGVKIDFDAKREWVHLRKSNTEPIIRIYAESSTESSAEALAQRILLLIRQIAGI
jgi:phosphomannomutase